MKTSHHLSTIRHSNLAVRGATRSPKVPGSGTGFVLGLKCLGTALDIPRGRLEQELMDPSSTDGLVLSGSFVALFAREVGQAAGVMDCVAVIVAEVKSIPAG